MMTEQILVLGATGMLGRPVVHSLAKQGNHVRILVRSDKMARKLFGDTVEIVSGSATNQDDLSTALTGCDAVHINLTQNSELTATQLLLDLAAASRLERITYVSATSASEQTRWFPMVDSKMRTEELIRQSGIPHTIFCPTWAMETLPSFYNGDRGVIIIGKNPPPLHFLAAADFGRIVAASYADDRALGKRLFIHGPKAITLPVALERYFAACYPNLKLTRLPLWQANLVAKITRRQAMAGIVDLIAYFDKIGEPGDPTETNTLFDPPAITLDNWFQIPH